MQVLTAETDRGRRAIAEVMQRSYVANVEGVPPSWARALVVDDVPVSFIVVDPRRQMEHAGEDLRYAFICDAATRDDRRREGHFRAIVEHTFASLRAAGLSLVITHGRFQLYRRFGFAVFTHHSGVFTTPQQIESALGVQSPDNVDQILVIDERNFVQQDLLLVADVKATTLLESRAALRAAAAEARGRGKTRILFEHPRAPSYGSRYPIHSSLETPFVTLARACGAQVCVQGAAPESSSVPDADWVKVLDAAAFLREALRGPREPHQPLPVGLICFDTEAGPVTIESVGDSVSVSEKVRPQAVQVKWPSTALAQLVTGYRSIEVLNVMHDTRLADEMIALVGMLFPRRWRLSRNEGWTFKP